MPLRNFIDALEDFSALQGVAVFRTALSPWVVGRMDRNQIVLRSGLSEEQQLLTLVHELTHFLAHRPDAQLDRTVCEYEAEAVEALVMARLGLPCSDCTAPGADSGSPTDDLLPVSVRRVVWASGRICHALGLEYGR